MGSKGYHGTGAARFHPDLNAILAAVTEKTKLIYLCNPNNPTGTISTSTEVEKFWTSCPTMVPIFDEAYKNLSMILLSGRAGSCARWPQRLGEPDFL